eukprot:COSAG06_NODE_21405_length_758_cov_1.012140_1_plen_81_part_00
MYFLMQTDSAKTFLPYVHLIDDAVKALLHLRRYRTAALILFECTDENANDQSLVSRERDMMMSSLGKPNVKESGAGSSRG